MPPHRRGISLKISRQDSTGPQRPSLVVVIGTQELICGVSHVWYVFSNPDIYLPSNGNHRYSRYLSFLPPSISSTHKVRANFLPRTTTIWHRLSSYWVTSHWKLRWVASTAESCLTIQVRGLLGCFWVQSLLKVFTGALRYIKTLKPWPLRRVMIEKYLYTEAESVILCDFLEPMLNVDFRARINARDIKDHKWLEVNPDD